VRRRRATATATATAATENPAVAAQFRFALSEDIEGLSPNEEEEDVEEGQRRLRAVVFESADPNWREFELLPEELQRNCLSLYSHSFMTVFSEHRTQRSYGALSETECF
jgi:hypothetical protein